MLVKVICTQGEGRDFERWVNPRYVQQLMPRWTDDPRVLSRLVIGDTWIDVRGNVGDIAQLLNGGTECT